MTKPALITNNPRLLQGGLSGTWYVVTKWRDLGRGRIEAHTKYPADLADIEAIRRDIE